jgi:predicted transposase YbfD/YdcC
MKLDFHWQVKINDKSNEFTAILELLNLIDISGLFVIIDAIGIQTNIANKIIDKKGNSVENISTIRKIVFNLENLIIQWVKF